ncbi:MAG: radical SAM protein [candidate division WOR-3 bacterium]|nr:radical SAM protein [candidate division WOR-3 bacterium]
MLQGVHFLLTYMCNFECDHCFVYSGPKAPGTFTLNQIRDVIDEMTKIDTAEWVYFEGGEPFLFYPIMIEGIKIARDKGFKVGLVSNSYFATTEEDAEIWLKPLIELGISILSVSDDPLHHGDERENSAKRLIAAANNAGIPVRSICIEKPAVGVSTDGTQEKGEPVVGGDTMLRGRAVEKLIEGLPKKHWDTFTECPHEELVAPKRIHVDPYGHTHMCQGLSMGNMWEIPLSELDKKYDANLHPVCGPLVKGGPALLAKTYDVKHEDAYVDACHFCYVARKSLIDKFPQFLAPRQVYGLE